LGKADLKEKGLFPNMDQMALQMDCLDKMTAVSKIVNAAINDIVKALGYGRQVNETIETTLKNTKANRPRVKQTRAA